MIEFLYQQHLPLVSVDTRGRCIADFKENLMMQEVGGKMRSFEGKVALVTDASKDIGWRLQRI